MTAGEDGCIGLAPVGCFASNALGLFEDFLLNARRYWPGPEALDGRWTTPAIERLD